MANYMVKLGDWPKLSGVWFLFQTSILDGGAMVFIFEIFGNGCIYIWYTSLISVHYNLDHGLAIVTESFSPLNLNYRTSFVKVWIRNDIPSHAIPCHVH